MLEEVVGLADTAFKLFRHQTRPKQVAVGGTQARGELRVGRRCSIPWETEGNEGIEVRIDCTVACISSRCSRSTRLGRCVQKRKRTYQVPWLQSCKKTGSKKR